MNKARSNTWENKNKEETSSSTITLLGSIILLELWKYSCRFWKCPCNPQLCRLSALRVLLAHMPKSRWRQGRGGRIFVTKHDGRGWQLPTLHARNSRWTKRWRFEVDIHQCFINLDKTGDKLVSRYGHSWRSQSSMLALGRQICQRTESFGRAWVLHHIMAGGNACKCC